MLSGAGELEPETEVGGPTSGREPEGLKRPGEDTGVLVFVLSGSEAEGGIWAKAWCGGLG